MQPKQKSLSQLYQPVPSSALNQTRGCTAVAANPSRVSSLQYTDIQGLNLPQLEAKNHSTVSETDNLSLPHQKKRTHPKSHQQLSADQLTPLSPWPQRPGRRLGFVGLASWSHGRLQHRSDTKFRVITPCTAFW